MYFSLHLYMHTHNIIIIHKYVHYNNIYHNTSRFLNFDTDNILCWKIIWCWRQSCWQHPWPFSPLDGSSLVVSPDIAKCSPMGKNNPWVRTTATDLSFMSEQCWGSRRSLSPNLNKQTEGPEAGNSLGLLCSAKDPRRLQWALGNENLSKQDAVCSFWGAVEVH